MIKIAVIDNEEIIRSLLYELLSGEGYVMVLFDSGVAAISEVRKNHFDIAIVDYHMPGLDGIETIMSIREIDPHTVFLMMSSHRDKFFDDTTAKENIPYLQKPFEINELRQVVDRIIHNLQPQF